MRKAIIICVILALVLIPASVMAAGFCGQNTASGPATGQCTQGQCLQGQAQCLKNNQTCNSTACPAGQGLKEQRRFCSVRPGNSVASTAGTPMNNGGCQQARSMKQLRTGLCCGSTTSP